MRYFKDEPDFWFVADDEVGVYDAADNCQPSAGGDYNGHCGGCDMCMLMQFEHWGSRVVSLEPDKRSWARQLVFALPEALRVGVYSTAGSVLHQTYAWEGVKAQIRFSIREALDSLEGPR